MPCSILKAFTSLTLDLSKPNSSQHYKIIGVLCEGHFQVVRSLNFKATGSVKFTDTKLIFYCQANKTHFHKKGFTRSLAMLGSEIFWNLEMVYSMSYMLYMWNHQLGKDISIDIKDMDFFSLKEIIVVQEVVWFLKIIFICETKLMLNKSSRFISEITPTEQLHFLKLAWSNKFLIKLSIPLDKKEQYS